MQGADPKLIDALGRASNLELFQLSAIIDRMLADPKRIIAVRANLHLGQTVRFLDYRDGQMRSGKVVALKDTQLTLHEDGTRREWKLPYAAIEPPPPTATPAPPPATSTPPSPSPPTPWCWRRCFTNTTPGRCSKTASRMTTATLPTARRTNLTRPAAACRANGS